MFQSSSTLYAIEMCIRDSHIPALDDSVFKLICGVECALNNSAGDDVAALCADEGRDVYKRQRYSLARSRLYSSRFLSEWPGNISGV